MSRRAAPAAPPANPKSAGGRGMPRHSSPQQPESSASFGRRQPTGVRGQRLTKDEAMELLLSQFPGAIKAGVTAFKPFDASGKFQVMCLRHALGMCEEGDSCRLSHEVSKAKGSLCMHGKNCKSTTCGRWHISLSAEQYVSVFGEEAPSSVCSAQCINPRCAGTHADEVTRTAHIELAARTPCPYLTITGECWHQAPGVTCAFKHETRGEFPTEFVVSPVLTGLARGWGLDTPQVVIGDIPPVVIGDIAVRMLTTVFMTITPLRHPPSIVWFVHTFLTPFAANIDEFVRCMVVQPDSITTTAASMVYAGIHPESIKDSLARVLKEEPQLAAAPEIVTLSTSLLSFLASDRAVALDQAADQCKAAVADPRTFYYLHGDGLTTFENIGLHPLVAPAPVSSNVFGLTGL